MKSTYIAIVIFIASLGMAFYFSGNKPNPTNYTEGKNVSIVGEKQIVEIDAQGGYWPRVTSAKAGIPTTLKVTSKGFDCSAFLVIPSLNYSTRLTPSKTTEIEIPAQESGKVIKGLCSMGMYSFQLRFN